MNSVYPKGVYGLSSINNNTNRKVGAVLSIANMLVSLAVGLVYTPFVMRFLGDSEYGVYTVALSLISYFTMLDLGFGNALVRYSARARGEGKEEKNIYGMFFLLYLGVAAIALAAGAALYFFVGNIFSAKFTEGEIAILKNIFIVLLANTVVAFPCSVFSSIIRSNQKFIFANTLTLIMNIVKHGLSLVLLFNGFKSVTLALVVLGVTLLTAVINIFFCFGKIKIKMGFRRFERGFYKEVFGYSFFILLNIIVDLLYSSTDKVILGAVCGSVAAAIYGAGVTFQVYFQEFSTAISGVFLPHISELSAKENAIPEMSKIFVKVGRIQFTLLSFILLGFTIFGREFIALWAPAGYGDAYFIALLIMVPAIIPLSQNIGISVLQALNRHWLRSVMYLAIAILNIGISIPLAQRFSGIGAALGTCIATCLGQIAFMSFVYGKLIGLDIKSYWKTVLFTLIKMIPVCGLFLSSHFFFAGDSWGRFVIKVGVAVALSAPYLWFVVLRREERDAILRKLRLKKG